jgi:hypothetical protein
MRRFKPFMRSKCGHGLCADGKCVECPHYNPHFLGIRVSKKVANILYNIEYLLINLEFPEVFW